MLEIFRPVNTETSLVVIFLPMPELSKQYTKVFILTKWIIFQKSWEGLPFLPKLPKSSCKVDVVHSCRWKILLERNLIKFMPCHSLGAQLFHVDGLQSCFFTALPSPSSNDLFVAPIETRPSE